MHLWLAIAGWYQHLQFTLCRGLLETEGLVLDPWLVLLEGMQVLTVFHYRSLYSVTQQSLVLIDAASFTS